MYKEILENKKNIEKAFKQVFGDQSIVIDSHIDFKNQIVIKGYIDGRKHMLEINENYYTVSNLIELGGGWNSYTFYKPFVIT